MPSPGHQAGTWCGLAGPQGSVLFPSTGTMLAPSPVCVLDGAVRLPVISGPSPRWALALVVQVGVYVWLSPESAWELWPREGPKQQEPFRASGTKGKGLRMVFSGMAVCSMPSAVGPSITPPVGTIPGPAGLVLPPGPLRVGWLQLYRYPLLTT